MVPFRVLHGSAVFTTNLIVRQIYLRVFVLALIVSGDQPLLILYNLTISPLSFSYIVQFRRGLLTAILSSSGSFVFGGPDFKLRIFPYCAFFKYSLGQIVSAVFRAPLGRRCRTSRSPCYLRFFLAVSPLLFLLEKFSLEKFSRRFFLAGDAGAPRRWGCVLVRHPHA